MYGHPTSTTATILPVFSHLSLPTLTHLLFLPAYFKAHSRHEAFHTLHYASQTGTSWRSRLKKYMEKLTRLQSSSYHVSIKIPPLSRRSLVWIRIQTKLPHCFRLFCLEFLLILFLASCPFPKSLIYWKLGHLPWKSNVPYFGLCPLIGSSILLISLKL